MSRPKIIVPTFTPFRADGSLNPDAIAKQASYCKEVGAQVVYVNGTTGEGLSLSVSERKRVAEEWAKHGRPGLTVVMHVGAESLLDSRELAAHAESVGCDGIAAVAPSYFRAATVTALVDFMSEVAAAAPKTPFYYYHFPGMTNVHIKPSQFMVAARDSGKFPTLRGAKFTDIDTEDFGLCVDQGFEMWTGYGLTMALSTLSLGSSGLFAYSFQVHHLKKILDAWEKKDLEEARKLQTQFWKLSSQVANAGGLPAAKALKSALVVDVGSVRLPLKPINEEAKKKLI